MGLHPNFSTAVLSLAVITAVVAVRADETSATATASPEGPTRQELIDQILMNLDRISDHLKHQPLDQQVISKQRNLVEDLNRLIRATTDDISAAAPVSGSSAQPTDTSNDNNRQGTEPSRGNSEQGNNGDGAADSTQPANSTSELSDAGLLKRKDLADAVWGHLPPRERHELIRSFNERYLPKYDAWVRRYFEALAEAADRDRSTDTSVPSGK